jgi:hypothetical protein
MNVRQVGLIAAAIAAFSPAISHATTERAALDACARAFAMSLAAPGGAAPTFRLVYGSPHNTGSMSEYFAREYTFELRADSQKTGLPIARASCSTDARGAVIALSPIPMEAVRATLATR